MVNPQVILYEIIVSDRQEPLGLCVMKLLLHLGLIGKKGVENRQRCAQCRSVIFNRWPVCPESVHEKWISMLQIVSVFTVRRSIIPLLLPTSKMV